jgi:hypothetical protein
MSRIDLTKISEHDLVAQFRRCAYQTFLMLLDSNIRQVTKLYWEMDAVKKELKSRTPNARMALAALLDDPNYRVQYEAAIRVVAVDRAKAIETLKRIDESEHMPEAAEARGTLRDLANGSFNPT